jgi:hypothetical protein
VFVAGEAGPGVPGDGAYVDPGGLGCASVASEVAFVVGPAGLFARLLLS